MNTCIYNETKSHYAIDTKASNEITYGSSLWKHRVILPGRIEDISVAAWPAVRSRRHAAMLIADKKILLNGYPVPGRG